MELKPFPQERINEILTEWEEQQERAAGERAAGLRCMCCNAPMIEPSPSGECQECEVL